MVLRLRIAGKPQGLWWASVTQGLPGLWVAIIKIEDQALTQIEEITRDRRRRCLKGASQQCLAPLLIQFFEELTVFTLRLMIKPTQSMQQRPSQLWLLCGLL